MTALEEPEPVAAVERLARRSRFDVREMLGSESDFRREVAMLAV
jgi:hypothetical protein